MIKNFNLFEARYRKYAGGNLFSNNHRIYLPSNCAMFDIDNFIIENDSIVGIVEDKFKFDSKELGNPLEGEGTWQRKIFNQICNNLSIDFYLIETSTDLKYLIKNREAKKVDSISGEIFNTSDRVYIELRYGKPKAIMFRTEGTKLSEIKNDKMFNVALLFSSMLGVDIYLINDIREEFLITNNVRTELKFIYLMKWPDGKIYRIIPNDPISWTIAYKAYNLL